MTMNVLFVTTYTPYSGQSSADPYDGLCGLMATLTSEGAQLIVPELARKGLIDKSMFATSYHEVDQQSYIYFGGYEVDKAPSVTWFPLIKKSNKFWQIKTSSVYYGESFISDSISDAILDTGTSLTYFPYGVFASLI